LHKPDIRLEMLHSFVGLYHLIAYFTIRKIKCTAQTKVAGPFIWSSKCLCRDGQKTKLPSSPKWN